MRLGLRRKLVKMAKKHKFDVDIGAGVVIGVAILAYKGIKKMVKQKRINRIRDQHRREQKILSTADLDPEDKGVCQGALKEKARSIMDGIDPS